MILECKTIKEKTISNLKDKISKLNDKLTLVVIQVGDDPASNVYVKQKEKTANELNVNFIHEKLDSNVTEAFLINLIEKYNNDTNVNGILVQMPLPPHINELTIQNKVNYLKDVDGLTDINMGRLAHNKDTLVPCTPLGIMEILSFYNIDVEGKNVVVVGRSNLVGKPISLLLTNNNATVTLCHSKTKNLKELTKNADILISAVGKKGIITKDMIKHGSTVIDVGINRIDNKLYGDVEECSDICNITPVPKGVGQMTVACLYKNLYKAYNLQKQR